MKLRKKTTPPAEAETEECHIAHLLLQKQTEAALLKFVKVI